MKQHQKIIFLEYLRCFAFISVLLSHLFPGGASVSNETFGKFAAIYNAVMPFFWSGGTGVYVFFLVSGYIITASALNDVAYKFVIRRIFRIYPLYIAAVVAQFYFVDGSIPPWEALGPRLSLLGDFTHTGQVLNGVDWTLRVEIVFYAGMALLCLVPKNHRTKAFAVSLLPAIAICSFMPDFPNWSENTFGFFNKGAPFLVLGSAIYLFETKRISLALFLLVAISAYANFFARSLFIGEFDRSGPVSGALFAVAWLNRYKLPQSRSIIFLASLTYSVYLFHNWLFKYIYAKIGISDPFNSFISLALMFLICWAAYIVIEKPAILIGKAIIQAIDKVYAWSPLKRDKLSW